MTQFRSVLAIIFAIGFGVHSGHAADYLFKIPVDFRALPPEVYRLQINCTLFTSTGTIIKNIEHFSEITSPTIRRTVDVAVSTDQGDARVAGKYRCEAFLFAKVTAAQKAGTTEPTMYYWEQGNGVWTASSVPPAGVQQTFPAAPGTQTLVTTGQLNLPR